MKIISCFIQVYRDGIFKLSCNCAAEAAKRGVQRYIELSTAHMLPSDKACLSHINSMLFLIGLFTSAAAQILDS